MVTYEEADREARRIARKAKRLSALSWEIDQILFRLRIARVGETGISHRTVQPEQELLVRLEKTVQSVLEQEKEI